MTVQKERRATLGGEHRRGEHRPKKDTRFVPPVQGPVAQIDAGVDALLTGCMLAERQAIGAGWHDPVGLHNAGHAHNLAGRDFADREAGFLFSYLVTCADLNRTPNVNEACIVGWEHGADLDDVVPGGELLDLLNEYSPVVGADLDDLVAAVAFWNCRRIRAQRHLRAVCRFVDVAPARVALPLHKRNGKRNTVAGSWLRSNNHAR